MSGQRIGIYTCVTGNYDKVAVPREVDSALRYICFTDAPSEVPEPWKAVCISTDSLGPKDYNRFAKMQPFELPELQDLDASLYVDGSFTLGVGLRDFIEKQLQREGDIFMFLHPYRSTVFAEGVAACEGGHEWPLAVARQLRNYSLRGFRDKAPLFAGGVILRRHTENVRLLMDVWWAEYLAGARRDQLSLGFAIERTRINVESLGPMPLREGNEQLSFKKHAAKKPPISLLKRFVGLTLGFCKVYPLLFGRSAPPDVVHPIHQMLARLARSSSPVQRTRNRRE